MQTFLDFYEAQTAAGETGSVGAVVKDDVPLYFVHGRDADEMAIRELAYEAYHGSPMSDYERYVLTEAMAEKVSA